MGKEEEIRFLEEKFSSIMPRYKKIKKVVKEEYPNLSKRDLFALCGFVCMAATATGNSRGFIFTSIDNVISEAKEINREDMDKLKNILKKSGKIINDKKPKIIN